MEYKRIDSKYVSEETVTVNVTKENSKVVEKYYGQDVANDFTARVQLPVSLVKRMKLRNKIYKIKNTDEN